MTHNTLKQPEVLEKLLQTKKPISSFYRRWQKHTRGRAAGKNEIPWMGGRAGLTGDQEIWLIQNIWTPAIRNWLKASRSASRNYPNDERGQLLMAWLNMYQGNQEKPWNHRPFWKRIRVPLRDGESKAVFIA
jgi:hypothetical protein